MRFTIAALVCVVVSVVAPTRAAQQETWSPPRLEEGILPVAPDMLIAVSGGEVFLELSLSSKGTVSEMRVLRSTPPFTEVVLEAVRGWTFLPAERTIPPPPGSSTAVARIVPVESRVLVAFVFTRPALLRPTLGSSSPADIEAPTAAIAAPVDWPTPGFPPRALLSGTVLTRLTVDTAGNVADAEVVQPADGFTEVAMRAARQWSFRPARIDGRVEQTNAYVAYAFRPPLTSAGPVR